MAKKCPNCGAPTVHDWRPFCSERCKMVDLGRWFGEVYRIPVHDDNHDKTLDEE